MEFRVSHDFFVPLVERQFESLPPVNDAEVMDYIASLLSEFTTSENLYKIRGAAGQPLDDVGQMLIASNPLLDADSFDRERQVRKHIGDFTLFFSGMFPESIQKWRLRHERLDSFVDYVKAGKESYYIVSEFNLFEYRKVAPLFRKLSEDFEMCVFGLNMVRRELDFGQPGVTKALQEIIN